MELADLFSPGSNLADIPGHFVGMPLKRWKLEKLSEQARATYLPVTPSDAPLSKKAIWSPRDSYGMKSI